MSSFWLGFWLRFGLKIPIGMKLRKYIKKKLKPRIANFLFNDNSERLKFEKTSAFMNDWKIDMLWMLNYLVNFHSLAPLWSGWNFKLIETMQ